MNLYLKEKLFVQRSQQRGQARNIIWNCRAIHLCWTEPVLLLCLLCLVWRGVFWNRENSASSPIPFPVHWLRWFLSAGADCSFPGRSQWWFGERSCHGAEWGRERNQRENAEKEGAQRKTAESLRTWICILCLSAVIAIRSGQSSGSESCSYRCVLGTQDFQHSSHSRSHTTQFWAPDSQKFPATS